MLPGFPCSDRNFVIVSPRMSYFNRILYHSGELDAEAETTSFGGTAQSRAGVLPKTGCDAPMADGCVFIRTDCQIIGLWLCSVVHSCHRIVECPLKTLSVVTKQNNDSHVQDWCVHKQWVSQNSVEVEVSHCKMLVFCTPLSTCWCGSLARNTPRFRA